MGFFDKAKNLYSLQKQAKQIKNELKTIHVEAETDGIKIVVDGEQEFQSVEIPESMAGDTKRVSKAFIDASNKAIKKSQQIGAEKMKGVMGNMFGA
ncbi:YbaB/EbfC family nucleoid-associated protein [Candidatus Peregrinibacteria bacterium]|nr:YbaB/EbfC family nucleoid-associated protein [Candidatus Peregrinibacteria bacterium]